MQSWISLSFQFASWTSLDFLMRSKRGRSNSALSWSYFMLFGEWFLDGVSGLL